MTAPVFPGRDFVVGMKWTRRGAVLGAYVLLISVTSAFGDQHGGHDHDHDDHNHSTSRQNSTTSKSPAEAYLYGTLSVIIVSCLSLAGVMVLPLLKQKTAYNSVMLLFMSLAVGTMTSDAVLHLIPETLGLHSHEQGDSDHDHEGDHQFYLGKMVLILATLYGLYQLEIVAHVLSRAFKKRSAVHDSSSNKAASAKTPEKDAVEKVESGQNNSKAIEMRTIKCEHGHGHGHSHSPPGSMDSFAHVTICGLPSVAFMMTASDALHNFTDGLAIGAAFAKSSASGLAVSIAVVCHELPHEVGDFAVLLNAGLSVKKALILNFICALTCFLGVYPGIAAGQQESLRQWVFAAVAGGFLYVALVHMIREIKEFGPLPQYLSILLQNLGILIGFAVILLLAIYEDELSSAI